MRKFPDKAGGLKDRQPMLSSGEDVTSISWRGKASIKTYTSSWSHSKLLSFSIKQWAFLVCQELNELRFFFRWLKGVNKPVKSTRTAGTRSRFLNKMPTTPFSRWRPTGSLLPRRALSQLSSALLPHRNSDSTVWAGFWELATLMNTSGDSSDRESQGEQDTCPVDTQSVFQCLRSS